MKPHLSFLALLTLGACQALSGPDMPATLQAQNMAYSTEATALQITAEARQTRVIVTAQAAATEAAVRSAINRVLLATVQAGNPPTLDAVEATALEGSTGMVEGAGPTQFVEIGTASRVRHEVDGCREDNQAQFSSSAPRIYVVARAVRLAAGTRVSIDWFFEGQLVHQDNWTAPNEAQDICIWFFITPEDVTFTPGSWSARIYANGQPVDPIVAFTITS